MGTLLITGGGTASPREYRFVQTSHSLAEGAPRIPIQVATTAAVPHQERIPFVLATPAVPPAQRAARNTDFKLVKANGDPLDGDYFTIEAGETVSQDVYLEVPPDNIIEGTKVRNLRVVASNPDATLAHGVVGNPAETVLNCLDATQLLLGFVNNGDTVVEPDGTDTVTVDVPLRLTAMPPGEVRAQITATSSNAVLGTHYELPETEAVFAANTVDATFPVRVLGNNDPGDDLQIQLQIQQPTGGASVSAAASLFALEIVDNDMEDPVLGFSPNHNGQVVLREGNPPVSLRIDIENGVVARESIAIAWAVTEVGGSGVAFGTHIVSSSAQPLILGEGADHAILELQAPQLSGIHPPREFLVQLTGVTGDQATLGDNDELDGTLVDTSTAQPNISWEVPELSVIEGGTIQGFLVLDTPAPNALSVNTGRTGSAGPPDLGYPGDTTGGVLTIPQGTSRHPVPFPAVADGENDPGEQATFTILGGGGYGVGAIPALTITVTEATAGSTTLEFAPAPSGEYTLIDVITGFDPTPRTSAPPMAIGGVRADVFPVDEGRQGGMCRAWQAVAYAQEPSGQAEMTAADGSEPYGPGYRTDDLSLIGFELQTHCENRPGGQFAEHTALLQDGILVETPREGHYIKEEVWFLRPRLASEAGTKHEHCGQVMVFIRRQPNGIHVIAQLMNEGFDIANPNAPGIYGNKEHRHELDGLIHFHSVRALQPVGNQVVLDTPGRCAGPGGLLIKPAASGKPHRLPPGRNFVSEYWLFHPGDSTAFRESVMGQAGWATAESGTLAFDKKDWFGLSANPLPRYGNDYIHRLDGTRGRAASRSLGRRSKREAEEIIAGTRYDELWKRNTDIGGEVDSYFEPPMMPQTYTGGGVLIDFIDGVDYTPEYTRGLQLKALRQGQVHQVGVVNVRTGRQITASEFVAANTTRPLPPYGPETPGKFPYLLEKTFQTNPFLNFPYFVPKTAAKDGGTGPLPLNAEHVCLRPTDRDWNAIPSGGICEPLTIETFGKSVLDPDDYQANGFGGTTYTYGPCDIDHMARVDHLFQGLAFTRNCPWAKYRTRLNAVNMERMFPNYEYGDIINYSTITSRYKAFSQGLPYVQPSADFLYNGENSHEWGSFPAIPEGGHYRDRGGGHGPRAQCAGGLFTSPDAPEYQERVDWYLAWRAADQLISSPSGIGLREGRYDRNGNGPLSGGPSGLDFPTNAIGQGLPEWENPLALSDTATQGYKQSFKAKGSFDGFMVYDGLPNIGEIEKLVVTMALHFTREGPNGSRTPGRPRANAYAISSRGGSGLGDAPSPILIEHPFIPGPGNSLENTGMADFRFAPLYGSALKALHIQGRFTERDELLGYIKLHVGLDVSASMEALDAELSLQSSRPTNYSLHSGTHGQSSYYDLHAVVQRIMAEKAGLPQAPEIISATPGAGSVTLEVQ